MGMLRKPWDVIRRYSTVVLWLLVGVFTLQRSDLKIGNQVERVRFYTRSIEFDYVTWTWDALWLKASQVGLGAVDYIPEAQQSQIVLDYLDLVGQLQRTEWEIETIYADPNIADKEQAAEELQVKAAEFEAQVEALAPLVEAVFQNQLSSVVADLDLALGGQPVPPVMYHVTPLPLALIVSPRDVIRQDTNISLIPEMTTEERDVLEAQVDEAMEVSSLVVNVGGVGLYPTMVMETSNINWLAEVVSHEWVHNFLTLRPLGASYGATPEMRIINETVANLSEKEIGGALIERYYPQFVPPPAEPSGTGGNDNPAPEPAVFDYRAEMHITRVGADELLAEGKIDEAEAFMEARRQVFWENGYRIRKINQAYFAFHGAYADQPGGAAGASEDPIGEAVRKLRSQSDSLADFLDTISWMWTYEQLLAATRGD